MKPTQEQLQKAREYLNQRISNQEIVEQFLRTEFEEAALKIAQIVQKYKSRNMKLRFTGSGYMAREIREVIDELESKIEYYVRYYCIPDEADDSEEDEYLILDTVFGEDHGATYKQRSAMYMSGIIKAISGIDFYEDEYDEDTMVEMIESASDKSINRMTLLALNSIAVGFGFYALLNATNIGKTQFISYVNSSNPCKYCSTVSGIPQPIENYPNGSYHPRCRCIFVFV